MVFPRKVGFGPCYLVSKRHEILSNIDRNAKPTGTRLWLQKNLNEMNTARAQILSLAVSVVFQLFDFQLSMFLEVQSKKVILEFP